LAYANAKQRIPNQQPDHSRGHPRRRGKVGFSNKSRVKKTLMVEKLRNKTLTENHFSIFCFFSLYSKNGSRVSINLSQDPFINNNNAMNFGHQVHHVNSQELNYEWV
jgi:hypothetical protein